MPVYQYVCTECAEPLEVRQSFTDDPLTVCPACEGRLRKVLSPVGVVFKGSGFYHTDSRAAANGSSNGHASKSKSDSSADSGKDSQESSSSDSKGSDSNGSGGSGSTSSQKSEKTAATTT